VFPSAFNVGRQSIRTRVGSVYLAPPLVLLHGGQARGGAAVERPDRHHLGLVQVTVALAHRPRHAEDGERLALVRFAGKRGEALLHERRHRLGLRVVTHVFVFILLLHVQPALHGRRHRYNICVIVVALAHDGAGLIGRDIGGQIAGLIGQDIGGFVHEAAGLADRGSVVRTVIVGSQQELCQGRVHWTAQADTATKLAWER
jgi:hypothetical protein